MRQSNRKADLTIKTGYSSSVGSPKPISYRETTRSRTLAFLSRSDITRVTPDASGFRKPTPYTATGYTIEPGAVHVELTSSYFDSRTERQRYFRAGASGSYWIHRPPTVAVTPSTWDDHLSLSIMRARNNVADRKAAFGESLAELRSGIKDLAKGLRVNADILLGILQRDPNKVLRNFRKVNKHPTSKQRKEVKRVIGNKVRLPAQHAASSLLAVEWGLKPLIEDMNLLAQNIDGKLLSGKLRINGKGISYHDAEAYTDAPPFGWQNGAQPMKSFESNRRGVYTSLWFEIDSVGLRTLTELGLADVPQVAWAIVPWSFAVDWVIPISTWLKSLTATFGLKYKGGSSTGFARSQEMIYPIGKFIFYPPGPGFPYPTGSVKITPLKYKRFSMQRRVHITEPYPDFPSVKDPFGAYQATMSSALLLARIKALPRF